MKKFTVAGIQMDIVPKDPEKNLQRALELIDEAVAMNTQIICLPELFTTGFDYQAIEENAKPIPNNVTKMIGETARKSKTYIIAGSIPEKRDRNIYNTSIIFNPDGEIIGKYQKIHLFPLMNEDHHFQRGKEALVFDTELGKIGIMICYDLRFPELGRTLTLNGAEIIFLPSEFPYPRLDHWKVLLQARAIENQIYVVGVNRVGRDDSNTFFGHTSVIGPWGEFLSSSGEEECVVTADIDLDRVYEVREKIPCLDDRVWEDS